MSSGGLITLILNIDSLHPTYKNMDSQFNDTLEKMELVFNHELNTRMRTKVSTYCWVLRDVGYRVSSFNPLIEPMPEKAHFECETVETLKKIFYSIENNTSLKSEFIKFLKNKIENEKPVFDSGTMWDLSDLAFMTLTYLNEIDAGMDSLFIRSKKGINTFGYIAFLQRFIHNNYHLLSEKQHKRIRKFVTETNFSSGWPYDVTQEIKTMIDKVLFDNLNKSLEGINFEINQDQQKVKEKIQYFGLDKDIVKALNQIDEFIYSDTSNVISAGMIGNFREMHAILIKGINTKIKEKTKEDMRKAKQGESEMKPQREYLLKQLKLSSSEDDFIDSFINLLHQEGGHSFMSEKEYFRLARNIFIEEAYFLLTKLEKLYKENKIKISKQTSRLSCELVECRELEKS